ncbi:MAG TPA: radical SAM protein [Verrucomicrobiota bacterium]|jgi:MoaA/NifB/PqqE/SkfB family radical SAM enzyme|nr:radical SAM protein [Verrucomicrobiota bacterium]HRT55644.1 radical SAM protein [Candidatus Paceibacterota bacterium]
MMAQYWNIARMLLDRRVTAVPRRVLGELKRQGRRQLPAEVERSLHGLLPGLKAVRFVQRWLDGEQITRHAGQWVINSFLPPFPGPAFDRMFENLLSGRRLSPVSAFLAVTAACPYHCWHCSFKRREAGELSTGEWKRVISDLEGLGASLIGFTGGEPCTRPDLPELVAAAAGGGAATILFSSGAALDSGLLAQLKAAGLWSVCISLDHPDPAEHDRLRGAPGCFARAVENLRQASTLGFYTMVGAVATRSLLKNGLLPELHRLAARCGVHELRIVEPMPCGLLAFDPANALLNQDEIRALRRFHVETNRAGRRPKVCAFNQIESPELFGCGAGTQHLFIDAGGEVCPCDFTAMSFGNVTRAPLAQIWTTMSEAMGNPRRHCFIQRHYKLVRQHSQGRFPLPPDASLRVCAEAGREDLPDYFQQMLGRKA